MHGAESFTGIIITNPQKKPVSCSHYLHFISEEIKTTHLLSGRAKIQTWSLFFNH